MAVLCLLSCFSLRPIKFAFVESDSQTQGVSHNRPIVESHGERMNDRQSNGRNRRIVLKKSASSRKWCNSGNIVSSNRLCMIPYYNGFDLYESNIPGET